MRTKIIAIASLMLAACGDKPQGQTHNVAIDVGGSVVYAFDTTEKLGGVTVTLTDLDGNSRSATTSANGLWTIENVLPGIYIETYSATGYETYAGSFGLDAPLGENDVKNVFISRGEVSLQEERLRLTISAPFSVTLENGDDPTDGFNGLALVYRPSADGTVTATFSRRLLPGTGEVYLQFFDTAVFGTRSDTATETVFTIDGAAIDLEYGQFPNNGTDTDPYTLHHLLTDGIVALTPIHGDVEQFGALLRYNATP